MLRLRARSRRDERGLTLVLVALMASVLMMFVAFAVDVGGAFNQRRSAQSAVDAGALGGAQDLPSYSATDNNGLTLAGEVMSLAAQAVGVPDNAAWQSQWTTCSGDGGALSHVDPTYNCISYDSSYSQVRAKLPTQTFKTTFARVMGINSINVSAAAIASRAGIGSGAVLPFGLAGSGTLACLHSGQGGNGPPPCTGPTTGNFGSIDILLYGNSALGTTPSCSNGGAGARFSQNIAVGADHELARLNGPLKPNDGGALVDDDCVHALPDDLGGEPGDGGQFDAGMLHGTAFSDGKNARLQRFYAKSGGGNFDASATIESGTAGAVTVDDQGLWSFLNSTAGTSGSNTPTSCSYVNVFKPVLTSYASGSITQATLKTTMQNDLVTCFNQYNTGGSGVGCSTTPCAGILFDTKTNGITSPVPLYDLQLSTRFVYIPVLQSQPQNCPSSNNWCNVVVDFQPAYLQQLYGGCDSGGNNCKVDFSPGVHDAANNTRNQKGDVITALVMNKNMVPASLQDPYSLGQNNTIELIK